MPFARISRATLLAFHECLARDGKPINSADYSRIGADEFQIELHPATVAEVLRCNFAGLESLDETMLRLLRTAHGLQS